MYFPTPTIQPALEPCSFSKPVQFSGKWFPHSVSGASLWSSACVLFIEIDLMALGLPRKPEKLSEIQSKAEGTGKPPSWLSLISSRSVSQSSLTVYQTSEVPACLLWLTFTSLFIAPICGQPWHLIHVIHFLNIASWTMCPQEEPLAFPSHHHHPFKEQSQYQIS